ncbi:MAG TPA: TonB family protein [Terracidiphilus sp.]|jgi:TonB family protein
MIARAELSTNAQGIDQQPAATPKGMSVALIGPNDAHRQVVAKALASAQGRKVHEFIDYPASLTDLARMMETRFDVVLVDVDTDESYALQIISKLAELGPAVMAYSARTDDELIQNCTRAGASDFLPLPTEGEPAPEPAQTAVKPMAALQQPVSRRVLEAQQPLPGTTAAAPRPLEPRPPLASQPAARSNITPIGPERIQERLPEPRPMRVPEPRTIIDIPEPVPEQARPAVQQQAGQSSEDDEFAAWDAANLRRASMPPIPKPDSRPRPSLVPEKRPSNEAPRIVPEVEEEPVVAETPVIPVIPVERPPVSVDIFRSTQFHAEQSEAAEKQGANWVKWILIAAGPLVLALVLLIVFTRSSTPATTAAHVKEEAPAPTPAPAPVDPTANDRLIVNATGKPGSALPIAKPSAAQPQSGAEPGSQANAAASEQAVSPSPDAMAAQLVAPTRIAGQIKRPAPADEPPPSAPSTMAFQDNSSVPGSVFGSGASVKAAPHAVSISAGVAQGMLIRRTTPSYPKFAQDAHVTGRVVLKATITKTGNIEGIQVLSGPKMLAPSAVDAVKTWKYKPYQLDGQPVAVDTNITVVFGETR